MAKITMDVSEYETIMETKRLLEDSLKKERELEGTIKKLTTEKLKALEDAKMKVVKITKSQVDECILTNKPPTEIIDSIFNLLKQTPNPHYFKYHVEDIERAFFTKTKLTSFPTVTTTLHGLDEIKEEMKVDIKNEFKTEIEEARQLQNTTYKLKKEKENLVAELVHTNTAKEKLESSYERLIKERDDLVKRLTEIEETTKKTLSNVNFFTAYSKIQKLKTLLN